MGMTEQLELRHPPVGQAESEVRRLARSPGRVAVVDAWEQELLVGSAGFLVGTRVVDAQPQRQVGGQIAGGAQAGKPVVRELPG